MRIRTFAEEGAPAALAALHARRAGPERDYELELAKAEVARLSEALKEMAVKLTVVEEKAVGAEWPGPPPGRRGHQGRPARPARRGGRRGLAAAPGLRRARVRRAAHLWIVRRARGRLVDAPPGGSPIHGLLDEEAEAILALFDQWGETDRSHRKLAHRGSYLARFWVSPSSVRRVLFLADKHFRPQPRPGRSVRKPFPDWAEYTPNSIWIYDTTHFPAARMAVLIIEDLVSRKWLTEVVSVEETSTQVELAFTAALDREGLLELVDASTSDGLADLTVDDEDWPILLAVSDNGPQMRSGSTREFLALCAIAQHFGRPHTPTDQAWIESLNGHLKAEYPHPLTIRDPATLRAELAVTRAHYNRVRLHAGVG